ncbi:MAG TPA: hypothetical protein VE152_02880, partial [Acidimicrobiales bacterium]|nr:hypothetical protein [Acidimicrobiales bacterium]
ALPPIWGAQEDVAQLSAGMFSVGYSLAFVLPVLGGLAADATGSAHLVMAPAVVGALLSLGAATRVPRRRG